MLMYLPFKVRRYISLKDPLVKVQYSEQNWSVASQHIIKGT